MLTESRPEPADAAGGPVAPSLLLDGLRARWRAAGANDLPALAADIARWQQALWRFTSVGHIGKLNGPKAWMEPVDPFTARQDFKLKLPAESGAGSNAKDSDEVVLYLAAGDAGDGNAQDFVVWERPRLVAPGRPDVLLRDVRATSSELAARRAQLTATAAKCLGAAAEASAAQGEIDVKALAQRHGVAAESLSAWLDYLGIVAAGPVKLGPLIERKSESSSGYDFVKGWVGDDALSVLANSSDQLVRIPGSMKPHSVAVHPSPQAVGGGGLAQSGDGVLEDHGQRSARASRVRQWHRLVARTAPRPHHASGSPMASVREGRHAVRGGRSGRRTGSSSGRAMLWRWWSNRATAIMLAI